MSANCIVLYGINNLGKSTQAKRLVARFHTEGLEAVYLKYPIYDLAPSGPMLNAYLREGNPFGLTAREAQTLYAMNRLQYEQYLLEMLNKGIHVIAEDYTGTGIAWGLGAGVSREYLDTVNATLFKECIAFLFEGDRFTEATESGHKHETNNQLLDIVKDSHEELAREGNWIRVNANRDMDVIHEELWGVVKEKVLHKEQGTRNK